MGSLDNKTNQLEINLLNHKDILEEYPSHIATVTKENCPNLCVASDVKVLEETKLIISHNEMIHTPENILKNKNIVMTCFTEKWGGVRLTGTAEYYTSGIYLDICNENFLTEKNTPKGVIVVTVDKIEGIV